jgi:hypothetical protein
MKSEIENVAEQVSGSVLSGELIKALEDQEFGDVRSVLDEGFHPNDNSLLVITINRVSKLSGVVFDYSEHDGWGYDEH